MVVSNVVEEILAKVEVMTRKVGGLEGRMRHMQGAGDRILVLAGEEEPRTIVVSNGEERLGGEGVQQRQTWWEILLRLLEAEL